MRTGHFHLMQQIPLATIFEAGSWDGGVDNWLYIGGEDSNNALLLGLDFPFLTPSRKGGIEVEMKDVATGRAVGARAAPSDINSPLTMLCTEMEHTGATGPQTVRRTRVNWSMRLS
jgi:hypothetical protein